MSEPGPKISLSTRAILAHELKKVGAYDTANRVIDGRKNIVCDAALAAIAGIQEEHGRAIQSLLDMFDAGEKRTERVASLERALLSCMIRAGRKDVRGTPVSDDILCFCAEVGIKPNVLREGE